MNNTPHFLAAMQPTPWYQSDPAYVPVGVIPSHVPFDQGGVELEILRGRLELAATCKYGWRVMAAHIADAATALQQVATAADRVLESGGGTGL